MAKPAFIYAFDNLGPERFTELSGLLLGSRYKGFLLGGVGPDGGFDGEIGGEWHPETPAPLLNELIPAGKLVVFQFKHKTTARVGQAASRSELLALYKCSGKKKCELHRTLVQDRSPNTYVLVTNVEVNAPFRDKFIAQCKNEYPGIEHYQIIGLDELEMWITMMPELRHIYFPTIFGPPRFELKIKLGSAFIPDGPKENFFSVSVLNVGLVPSYVSVVRFRVLINNERIEIFTPFHGASSAYISQFITRMNPQPGQLLEPGKQQSHYFLYSDLGNLQTIQHMNIHTVYPIGVQVEDEIGNIYMEDFNDSFRDGFLEHIPQRLHPKLH
jgi:hypothetical protein